MGKTVSFQRKLTTTGDATGLTIPKFLADNEGYIKGRKVRVTLELLEQNVVQGFYTPNTARFAVTV